MNDAMASRRIIAAAEIILALVVLVAVTAGIATGRAGSMMAQRATPTPCPVTQPNGVLPPPGENVFGRGPGGHGNDELWTNVWTWGEGIVLVPPSHVGPSGWMGGMKWPWWRGVPGRLTIEGRRLDAPAPPMRADVPDGYGETGFQVSGLIFPSTGCWEITGRVGDARLTFVVQVVKVDLYGTPIARLRHPTELR